MFMPALSTGVSTMVGGVTKETGVSPLFCTPCVLGKRICGLPFSPHVENCGGGGAICTNIGPCIPFLNKQVRCCVPGGCSLVDC
jgi:hypothetical protein